VSPSPTRSCQPGKPGVQRGHEEGANGEKEGCRKQDAGNPSACPLAGQYEKPAARRRNIAFAHAKTSRAVDFARSKARRGSPFRPGEEVAWRTGKTSPTGLERRGDPHPTPCRECRERSFETSGTLAEAFGSANPRGASKAFAPHRPTRKAIHCQEAFEPR